MIDSDMVSVMLGEKKLRADKIQVADWVRNIKTALAAVHPKIDHLPFFKTFKEGLLECRGEHKWEVADGHQRLREALQKALSGQSDKKDTWDRMKMVVLYQHAHKAFILTRKGDLYYLRWTEVLMRLHNAQIAPCEDGVLGSILLNDFQPGYGGFALLEALTSLATCFLEERKQMLEAAEKMHRRLAEIFDKIVLPPRQGIGP